MSDEQGRAGPGLLTEDEMEEVLLMPEPSAPGSEADPEFEEYRIFFQKRSHSFGLKILLFAAVWTVLIATVAFLAGSNVGENRAVDRDREILRSSYEHRLEAACEGIHEEPTPSATVPVTTTIEPTLDEDDDHLDISFGGE